MNKYLLVLLIIVTPIEIQAREPIKPAAEVGQIIKDLEELHVEDTIQRGAPCKLDIQRDLPLSTSGQPLYLNPHKDTYWLPNSEGQLHIPRGASIELYCSHSFANVSNEDQISPGQRSIYARCLQDRTFEWSGGKGELKDFYCAQQTPYTVERLEQPCGDENAASAARIYRVGYNISAGRFVRILELCHDAEQLSTHYAHYQLLPANEHFQRQAKRVKFSTAGHFFGYDMARIYTQKQQKQRLEQLLQQAGGVGVELGSAGLFDTKAGLFLTRGHLAAKADLIYASQQRSSFNYLNVAPQWQSFNGGHWAIVEDETRRFVARSGLSVSVYTGTYGVMALPDANKTSFHLTTDANNNGVLAVPELYYRILVDNAKPWRGLALLGVNNPHATLPQILATYVICEPLQRQLVPWLRWLQKEKDLKKGYLYACSVADLAKVVQHLPPQLQEVHELI